MKNSDNFYCLQPESAAAVLNDLALSRDPSVQPRTDAAAASSPRPAAWERKGGVAVIPVSGPLARNTIRTWWGDVAALGYDDIAAAIGEAQKDPRVRAIMLDIDSPGGAVSGVEELALRIRAWSAGGKPMAAFTNSLMASAAYWTGSATGRVYSTPSAQVGSIGVIMALADLRGMAAKSGVAVNIITAGALKAAGNPYAELSDEARAHFQQMADGIHALFKEHVSAAMPVDAADPDAWADGRTFLGTEAREKGLVTRTVGGLEAAIETFLMEEHLMDRTELEAAAPDLVQALIEEGRAQAQAEAPALDASAFLSIVAPLMPAANLERAEKFFEACAAAHMDAEQIRAMAAVAFAGAEAPESEGGPDPEAQNSGGATPDHAEADSRAALLAAIQAAHAGPLAAMPQAPAEPTARDVLLKAATNKTE